MARLVIGLARSLAFFLVATGFGCRGPAVDGAWPVLAKGVSGSGKVEVVVRAKEDPIPVNKMHPWRVQVRRVNGGPFVPQALVVNGGMPAHGHGLPTQPSVGRYLGEGTFVIEGMRFNMGGDWELNIRVLDGQSWHRVTFPLVIGPAAQDRTSRDGWSEAELALVQSLSLAGWRVPTDPTNAVQSNPRAVSLGRALFFDKRLGANAKIACATCHDPEHQFADGRKTGVGLEPLQRNTPTVVGVAGQRWFYWDGRRDSLWAQALVPIEAPQEMGASRVSVVRLVAEDPTYRASYEALFGALPSLDAVTTKHAGPIGTPDQRAAWKSVPIRARRGISRAFANVGKSIAAFETTLVHRPTRFDEFAAGTRVKKPLSASELAGLRLFIDPKNQCMKCHNGPLLTNGGFHNVGTGSFDPRKPDLGRVAGVQAALLDEFNCKGRYSDDPKHCTEHDHLSADSHLAGAFKVPSLRGAAATAPYFHDGRFASLREVLEHYRTPPPVSNKSPHELLPLPHLTDDDLVNLEAFVRTLGPEG